MEPSGKWVEQKARKFIRLCNAINCPSTDVDGSILKKFPADPVQRKVWAEKIDRPKWAPPINSYLCEKHFNEDAWMIKTKRGKKSTRLKKDAVPSLHVSPSKFFQIVSKTSSPSKVEIPQIKQLHSYAKSPSAEQADPSSTVQQFVDEEESIPDLCRPLTIDCTKTYFCPIIKSQIPH